MERFLKAKHWQMFLIIFGLPFMFEIITMVFTTLVNNPMLMLKIMPKIMVLIMVVFLGWFWAIAIKLQDKLPNDLKLNTRMFKIFLFLPVIYILFLFILPSCIVDVIEKTNPAIFVSIIIPIHLFAMFCMFYCLYFVAKVFKTVELQRKVTFSDFAGEFFLIWFSPIGIWIIQPKINKMIDTKE